MDTRFLLGGALLASLLSFHAAASGNGEKRALLIAISRYASPEWDTLSSENDVPLVRAALELHGFPPESILVVSDEAATKKGLLEAIEAHISSASEGDIVVLHYSGHGQRIPDDNGDELDGYDEAWVPHDAPKSGEGYRGENHLRDDELNVILQRLRNAVGPEGNVILTIDSCFSGGTSRGTARVRGGPPLGPPAPKTAQDPRKDAGGGFFEEPPRTRSALDDSGRLAPYVVFSASRHDQLAYETIDDEGRVVGPLSLALSKSLGGPTPVASYRDLFESLEGVMQPRVPNRPQVEGNVDAEVFSGRAVVQQPFIDVVSVASSGRQVVLAAGSLQGLLKGAAIELHRAGAQEPAPDTLLSRAVVSEVTYGEAVADVETAARRRELEGARAFVTQYTFGDLRVKVALEEPGDQGQDLEEALGDVSAVELVDSEAELSVRAVPGGEVVVELARSGERIYGPTPRNLEEIRERLVDYARSRYLRNLRLQDTDFKIALEVVAIDSSRCRDVDDPTTCPEVDPSTKEAPGSERIFRIGDFFKLRVSNESDRASYVTLLDLPADGTIHALWPLDAASDKKQLKAGESWSPDVVYQFTEPAGNDVLLLIATEDWVDFRPFLSGARVQRSAFGLGPFAPLFDDEAVRTRSAFGYDPGSVTTDAVTVTIEP